MKALLAVALLLAASLAGGAEKLADPALDKLATLAGGHWVCDNGKGFTVEFTYALAQGGKAVRAEGTVNKGQATESHITAMYGWDPKAKKAYYIDFHDHQTVYKGTVTANGNSLDFDFAGLIGDGGTYRARLDLVDTDHFRSVILGEKDGKWVSTHEMAFSRHR